MVHVEPENRAQAESEPTGEERSLYIVRLPLTCTGTMRNKRVRHTTKLNSLLNTGIASAMIQASTHNARTIAVQEPTAIQLRLCM